MALIHPNTHIDSFTTSSHTLMSNPHFTLNGHIKVIMFNVAGFKLLFEFIINPNPVVENMHSTGTLELEIPRYSFASTDRVG
jgi:hypothetical protein